MVTKADKTDGERESERDRLKEWQKLRLSTELIWHSSVLAIIREPQQPLLNYRSHHYDWMRLGHCNINLIIQKLYYYSNNCIGKVCIFLAPSTFIKVFAEKSYAIISSYNMMVSTHFSCLSPAHGHNILGLPWVSMYNYILLQNIFFPMKAPKKIY